MNPNVERPEFEHEPDRPAGFRVRRQRLGQAAGARRIGVSLWELPPGEAAYPYHWHHAEEELVVVLAGTPDLRTPAGWRRLEQGEVVSFPPGEQGAHQLVNRTDEPVRFLAVSANERADVVVYPDSGKINAYAHGDDGRRVLREIHRRDAAVDYWDGEEPPSR